jgi:hypothetical protein
MKAQTTLAALTAINLALLGWNLVQTHQAQAADGILRGRGLQIVDAQGRVRAAIAVLPANPKDRYPDGRVGSPETVMLRLIDQHGRPNVKLGASEEGAGLGLGGEKDPTYARIAANGPKVEVSLTDGLGRERVLTAAP